MKKQLKNLLLTIICGTTLITQGTPQQPSTDGIVAPKVQGKLNYKLDDYRNYLGLWCGSNDDALQFARNMAIKHVIFKFGMEKHPLSKGMKFYYVDPEYIAYKREIDLGKKYSPDEIKKWRDFCAMKDASLPFPDCMATGWFWKFNEAKLGKNELGQNYCSLMPNLQKQKVIDQIIAKLTTRISEIQKGNPNFKFAGFVWDVPQLEGDFYGIENGRLKQVGMSFWNGKDSVSIPEGEKLDYPTYCEARIAYYRQIRAAAKKLNPDAKLIMDPYIIYGHYTKDYQRLGIKPNDPALADFVQMECGTDEYLRDKRAWDTGYLQTQNIGNFNDEHCYDFDNEIRAIGVIASLGGWSGWFGNPCPGQLGIREVPPRMKLSRSLATWENLNNTPIAERQWDLQKLTYNSPTAHISKKLIWATHPETKKILFCFMSRSGKIHIPEGMKVAEILPLNSLFGEYKPPFHRYKIRDCFKIENNIISVKKEANHIIGEAFSMTLKPQEE